MQIDLTKIATAVLSALIIGVLTYQLTTIKKLEIETELIKVRLEQVEKKLKKRGKNK
tara:strand:+ start:673 stop:843 length:171 start_codon:yes stop_codon:yes gene_type:complete